MAAFARSLSCSARSIKRCLQPSQKNQLHGVGLTSFSTVIPRSKKKTFSSFRYSIPPPVVPLFGNSKTGKEKEHVNSPPRNRPFSTLLTLGGLGLALTGTGEYKADCAQKQNTNEKCRQKTCEEETIEKANQDLEKALKDLKSRSMEATGAALKAYCEASTVLKEFMDKAYCAMDQDGLTPTEFEDTWCEVYDLAVKRCELVSDAHPKGECAWAILCQLREVIENGKKCTYTSSNPFLIKMEKFLNCTETELLNEKATLDCMESDSRMVEQYREVIEKFRLELKAELEFQTNNAKSPIDGDKAQSATDVDPAENQSTIDVDTESSDLAEDEQQCSKILTLAYKKVLTAQKELALLQIGLGKVPAKQRKTLC